MLRDAMEETGLFTVELACNGHEVLERIHAHEPELLVLDPALPGMDGIRVLRQLRRERDISHLRLRVRSHAGGGDGAAGRLFSAQALCLRGAV